MTLLYNDRFEYFCWFDDSNRFDLDLTINNLEVEKMIENMLPNLPINPKAQVKTYEQAVEYLFMIIANVGKAFLQENCVAIPRSNSFLNGETAISKRKLSKRTFLLILNFLRDSGYIREHMGHFDHNEQCGQTSRYWATKILQYHFRTLKPSDFRALRTIKPVILHDSQGNEIDFSENKISRFFSEKIIPINELYKSNTFKYINKNEHKLINSYHIYNNPNDIPNINNNKSYPLLGTNDNLYPGISAIFSRSSFLCGGRLYSIPQRGIGWQGLPQEQRKTITINDEATVELDFKGLHVSMLYAIMGIQIKEDPYSGLSAELRPLYKTLMLRLLNAKSVGYTVRSMSDTVYTLKRKVLLSPRDLKLLDCIHEYQPNWHKLIAELMERHRVIRRFFGSDCGVYLQRLDGEMMLHILSVLAQEGIPALPVHDSVIVPRHAQNRTAEVMQTTYRHYMGFDCVVEAK